MKTKLLSAMAAMVLFTGIATAQTKTWDFGNDHDTWPLGSGITTNQTAVDNLGLYANAPDAENQISNFGAVTSSNATFPDSFTGSYRFQMNGAGYTGGTFKAMPTQRFIFFNVSGACTIKVWFKTGSNGATRTIYVTDGETVIGSATSNTGSNADVVVLEANYTGGADQLYVYGDTACNLYKVEVTGATVTTPVPIAATGGFEKAGVMVYANEGNISLANVQPGTQADIYNITGALVRSVTTDADITVDSFRTGLYIVNVKSGNGQKSVKVLVK